MYHLFRPELSSGKIAASFGLGCWQTLSTAAASFVHSSWLFFAKAKQDFQGNWHLSFGASFWFVFDEY